MLVDLPGERSCHLIQIQNGGATGAHFILTHDDIEGLGVDTDCPHIVDFYFRSLCHFRIQHWIGCGDLCPIKMRGAPQGCRAEIWIAGHRHRCAK